MLLVVAVFASPIGRHFASGDMSGEFGLAMQLVLLILLHVGITGIQTA